MEYKEMYNKLKENGQEHLLAFYNTLKDEDKRELLSDIERIDFKLMQNLYNKAINGVENKKYDITPISYIDKLKLEAEEVEKAMALGSIAIKEGKLACITMAGGQGTRLGFDGPKGAYILDTDNNKSIFELLCDTLKSAYIKYGTKIQWYIMTSEANDKQTKNFFEENSYFDYGKENIHFFIQGELPMVSEDGKIILEEKGKIKFASDGHGGVFVAMNKNNVLQDMKQRKIEWVFIGAVDNPLVHMIDPLFLGLCEIKKVKLASKTVTKRNASEKVGVFCKKQGRPSVVEYTEITEEMANLRDENGELVYGESHILCNMFNVEILEKMELVPLEYHVAYKKSDYVNEEGIIIKPETPNAYKFESFIFDAFELADDILLLRTNRADEFAPVKNKEGLDSPKTSLEALREYRKRMEKCNV